MLVTKVILRLDKSFTIIVNVKLAGDITYYFFFLFVCLQIFISFLLCIIDEIVTILEDLKSIFNVIFFIMHMLGTTKSVFLEKSLARYTTLESIWLLLPWFTFKFLDVLPLHFMGYFWQSFCFNSFFNVIFWQS